MFHDTIDNSAYCLIVAMGHQIIRAGPHAGHGCNGMLGSRGCPSWYRAALVSSLRSLLLEFQQLSNRCCLSSSVSVPASTASVSQSLLLCCSRLALKRPVRSRMIRSDFGWGTQAYVLRYQIVPAPDELEAINVRHISTWKTSFIVDYKEAPPRNVTVRLLIVDYKASQ
jgi:hypothetical protein